MTTPLNPTEGRGSSPGWRLPSVNPTSLRPHEHVILIKKSCSSVYIDFTYNLNLGPNVLGWMFMDEIASVPTGVEIHWKEP